MADIKKLSPLVLKYEGGFVNDPTDKGGPTNMGITLNTWRQIGYDKNNDGVIDLFDIKMLDKSDFEAVLKRFWNKWIASSIKNQSVANILVDWYYNSGSWGIKIPQRILGVEEDGIVGIKTITALNKRCPKELFKEIFEARKKYLNDIIKNNPSQKKFINGWINRLNDFKFSE